MSRRGARPGGQPIVVAAALVLLVVVAAGCVQYSGSDLAARVRSWMGSSSFVSDNDTLIDDIARAHAAVSGGTALQLRTVCAGLEADTGTAYETLPSPSSSLTGTLNTAYETLFKAATSCAEAPSVRAPSVSKAFSKMTEARQALARAQGELASLGIRWVPRR